MLSVNGKCIYNQDTAYELLADLGMDKFDIRAFIELLAGDRIEELEYQRDVAIQEEEAQEAWGDSVRSLMCEVQSVCDEALSMQRISKPRERFEHIGKLINEYL